jgi:ribonuclease HI
MKLTSYKHDAGWDIEVGLEEWPRKKELRVCIKIGGIMGDCTLLSINQALKVSEAIKEAAMELSKIKKPSLIEVYSDGSGNTLESDGGYGWRIVVDGELLEEGSGYLPQATNNIAELSAAINGLECAAGHIFRNKWNLAKVVLVSDSQLVLGYASGAWRCKAEHLKPLKAELQKLYEQLDAEGRWVKGHDGDSNNEACDKLAKAGRLSKGKSE